MHDSIEPVTMFTVPMADLVVTRETRMVLCTNPLGACLGVAIYDPKNRCGGLMHAMLPDSSIDPQRASARPGMFLDTGLAAMLKRFREMKSEISELLVYVAGGGRIMDESAHFNIGQRNHEVLISLLEKEGMKIHAQEVGGLVNRAMILTIATGEVKLKISGQVKEKVLCKP